MSDATLAHTASLGLGWRYRTSERQRGHTGPTCKTDKTASVSEAVRSLYQRGFLCTDCIYFGAIRAKRVPNRSSLQQIAKRRNARVLLGLACIFREMGGVVVAISGNVNSSFRIKHLPAIVQGLYIFALYFAYTSGPRGARF